VEEGARVAIADRRVEEGQALAAELNAEHEDSARFVSLDITNEENWASAVEETVKAFGRLDALVNNAGMIRVTPSRRPISNSFRRS
jgi:3alpha(or 20beta)-hydroxysteroid dehydrogenase